jgi:Na+/melibiose symporter-like transporter
MRSSWRVLCGHRDLQLVLAAGLISSLGDWILVIGLTYRVYAVTGSTVASALTMLSSFVPQLVLGPVAGVFADRWDRKRTMIGADLLLAAGLLPLLAVRGAASIWIVFAVLIWEGGVQQFFSPAQQAMVPRLVTDDQLVTANALAGQVSDVSRLAGSGLGGVLAAAGGITAVALADAASFAVSAGLLALLRASGRVVREPQGGDARRLAAIAADLTGGLRLAARSRVLRALFVYGLVTTIGEGIMGTLMAPFVRGVLHGSSQDFGLVIAAQAVGGIAGGLLAISLSQRLPASRLFSYGSIAFGLVDLAIFLYPLGYVAVWPAVIGMVITGLPSALCLAGLITLFQRSTEDAYRGRVFGALSAVEGVSVLAGALGAGYLSRPLGVIPVLAVQGAGYLLAGIAMAYWLRATPDPDQERAVVPLEPAPAP